MLDIRPPLQVGSYARGMLSISITNSMGQQAIGTRVRWGGFSGKQRP
jgi:hypothetical protein